MHIFVILTKLYCDVPKAIHAVELQAPYFKSKLYKLKYLCIVNIFWDWKIKKAKFRNLWEGSALPTDIFCHSHQLIRIPKLCLKWVSAGSQGEKSVFLFFCFSFLLSSAVISLFLSFTGNDVCKHPWRNMMVSAFPTLLFYFALSDSYSITLKSLLLNTYKHCHQTLLLPRLGAGSGAASIFIW